MFSVRENEEASDFFYRRPPDAIVVFTGDGGRIPYAIKKALEYKQENLNIFITGVYSKNTVETLLRPFKINKDIDLGHLEIDYTARNTVENVISTLRYLRGKKGLDKVLIISHDYHIMRIKLIMNKLKTAEDNYQFYYSGIKTDYKNLRNLKLLYKEVFKLIRTYGFLLFWTPETPSESVLKN
ncbi:MAG: YdcF family protein [Bacteriovoracaceae bacterium]|nr:YdcF family protein [Bacteriovoracaceae bacterium]